MQNRSFFFAGVPWICALSCQIAGAAQPAKPLCINYTRFHVNFDLPTGASAKDEPREVELHASTDQGTTWDVVGTAKPSARRILFTAPADGEYWFMARTKYASGKYLPQGPPVPELKVVVDTAPPVLELDARDEQGEVVIRWSASDQHLKADSFKLEYRVVGPNAQWQRVAVDAAEEPPSAGELHGETTFVLPIREQSASIVVRAEATDAAGNHTVKEQPLKPPSVAESLDADGPPEMSPAFAPTAPPGERQPIEPLAYPKTATPDWPAEESPPLTDRNPPRETTGQPARRELSNASYSTGVQRLRELPHEGLPGDAGVGESTPPPGVQPHLVNKPGFELVYDVEAVGSAGIDHVELWMTKDAGQNWTKYGLDEDRRSPVTVKVQGEGLYGFRVVVETTARLRSPTPASGDLPDVWVEVDLTKPEARLISADRGAGDEADRLVVRWEASDRHLAGRGISLRWAESPQGPWNTIASGLENTGRYAWRLDQRLPQQLNLRLEARDDAGNITINQLAQPVTLDRSRPQGRIREVRPLGAAPQAARPAIVLRLDAQSLPHVTDQFL